MIELRNFTIGYEGKDLLENVDFSFPSHSLSALIGRNGTGKSTLLRALAGINFKYSGDVLLNGENIKHIKSHQLAKKIAFVNTQRPRIANLKVNDVVALGRTPHTGWHGKLSDRDQEIVKQALDMVGMIAYNNRYFNSLSDGEGQKVMIARAIAQDTPIIILDEPTSFLDYPTRLDLAKLLKTLTMENKTSSENYQDFKGKTIIYSTHELEIAEKFSDKLVLVKEHHLLDVTSQSFQI